MRKISQRKISHTDFPSTITFIHAKWCGTVARIAEKAIAEMKAAYDTRPEHLKAHIGPGIHLAT